MTQNNTQDPKFINQINAITFLMGLAGIRISTRPVAQSEWKFGWAPKIIHTVAQLASMIAWRP